jgi:MATE family multidrug resistance protein
LKFFSHIRFSFLEAKSNLKIAFPITISQLGHMSVAIADTLMSGWLGAIPLAASTIGLNVMIPFMMLIVGNGYGITPIAAQNFGAGNSSANASLLKNSMIANIVLTVVMLALLYFAFLNFHLFNPDAQVVNLGKQYFLIQSISILPLVVFVVLKQFAEGLAITKQATMITIVANVINIVLNYFLSQGIWRIEAMGIDGIAYATLLARLFMMLAIMLLFFSDTRLNAFMMEWKRIRLSWKIQFEVFKKCVPIGAQMMLESGAFAAAAIVAGWIGTYEVAAHQIALNLAATAYMIVTGIASAATVRVGFEYGKKDYYTMNTAIWTSVILAIFYEICSCMIFVLFRYTLPQLYINDSAIIELSASLLLITAFFQFSDGLQVIAMSCLRAISDVFLPTLISIMAYWVVGLPVGYILALRLDYGVQGIWYGLLIGLSISAILLSTRLYLKTKVYP